MSMNKTFRAYNVVEKDGGFVHSITEMPMVEPKENEIQIRVHWSSVNYKDALSAHGNRGVTKVYPHTPGIDASGVVTASRSELFKEGDEVVVTGYDLGMNTDGGFGEYITVPDDWAVHLPEGMSQRTTMIYGTAGLTAAMSVRALAQHVAPEDGPILVSGSTGGVGSTAIKLLHRLGYKAIAITGKPEAESYLRSIGADGILLRDEVLKDNHKAMLKPDFAGAIDVVGGDLLAAMIKRVGFGGAVTCCGNAASGDLNMTVYPFILRGISLRGIDSQHFPIKKREELWSRLAGKWKLDDAILEDGISEITMEDLDDYLDGMLAGSIKGRALLRHRA